MRETLDAHSAVGLFHQKLHFPVKSYQLPPKIHISTKYELVNRILVYTNIIRTVEHPVQNDHETFTQTIMLHQGTQKCTINCYWLKQEHDVKAGQYQPP